MLNFSCGFSGGRSRPNAVSEESMKRRKEWKRKKEERKDRVTVKEQ